MTLEIIREEITFLLTTQQDILKLVKLEIDFYLQILWGTPILT